MPARRSLRVFHAKIDGLPPMQRALAISTVALCAFMLFWRLDGVPIWRDEATTAVWGRLMAESGSWLPYVHDREKEQLLVQDDDGHDVNSDLLPAMQSYLQFYVSALGFKLLGVSTLTARLPFAVIGALTLFLLYRLGLELFGPGLWPLSLPLSGALSIYFLHAARQGRYYILVALATVLLLLLAARYLKNPELGRRPAFYAQLGAVGCLLYLSNYVSFAATWLALGLFFLLIDRQAFLRLCALSALLAVVLGVEFWLLHSEMLSGWSPNKSDSFWGDYRYAAVSRGRELWRWVPFVFLIPAAAFLSRGCVRLQSKTSAALGLLACAIPFLGFAVDYRGLRAASDPAFVLFGLLCLSAPAALLYFWTRLDKPGIRANMALLAALIVVVSPLFTLAVMQRTTSTRHYYQVCPAAIVLVGLSAAGLARAKRRGWAAACLAAAGLWPNLDWAGGGTEEVVPRQFLKNADNVAPMLDFLAAHTAPGERIAYYRNVKGMTANFYFPDRRWVNLLDVAVPHNAKFRGLVPDDQFDDWRSPDVFIVWDPHEAPAKTLDASYEQVWDYAYTRRQSFWDRNSKPRERKYSAFRKMRNRD